MKDSRYFKQAISHLQDGNYRSADGDWNAADGDWNADGFEGAQSGLMADGGGAPVPTPKANSQSLPYIVVLENTTTDTVSDVSIFNSAVTYGDFAVSGISITWGYSGVTYNTVLGRINSGQVFEVGQMRLIASSTVSGRDSLQVLQTVKLFTNTIDGKATSLQLNLQKDSFQYISNQVDSFYPFMIDSMTGLTFTILGSTTLQVYLYPKAATNPFNTLKGEAAPNTYANPHTNFSLKK
jgi:hypothetical protein